MWMIRITVCIIVWMCVCQLSFSQLNQADALIKVYEIGENLRYNDQASLEESMKQYKKLIKHIDPTSLSDQAVIHTKIAKAIVKAGYLAEAQPFFKKALNYRKRQGNYQAASKSMEAYYNNCLLMKDFKQAEKSTYDWINYLEKQVDSADWQIAYPEGYLNQYGENEALYTEYISKMVEISNNNHLWLKENNLSPKEETMRYAIGERMLVNFLQKYPNGFYLLNLNTKENSFPYYYQLIKPLLEKGELEKAQHWEKRAFKVLTKCVNADCSTNFIRKLALVYNTTENPKTGAYYKDDAVRVMKLYINACKKAKKHDQVVEAYRFIGLQYGEKPILTYKESIQSFAEAIRYAKQNQLQDEVSKTFQSIDDMLDRLSKEGNKKAWQSCKGWKQQFKLKGLSVEDIQTIDEKINRVKL